MTTLGDLIGLIGLDVAASMEVNADEAGELLRHAFFTDEGYGCYQNFAARPSVEELPDVPVPDEPGFYYTVRRLNGILMRYYWDGDGYLEFILPDGRRLWNADCKKDRYWEWAAA